MVYSAVSAFCIPREETHQEVAERFARYVQHSGGCLPSHLLPRLVQILDGVACLDGVKALMQERDDLKEQLRASRENVKLLSAQMFVQVGEGNLVQATAPTDIPQCDHPVTEQA